MNIKHEKWIKLLDGNCNFSFNWNEAFNLSDFSFHFHLNLNEFSFHFRTRKSSRKIKIHPNLSLKICLKMFKNVVKSVYWLIGKIKFLKFNWEFFQFLVFASFPVISILISTFQILRLKNWIELKITKQKFKYRPTKSFLKTFTCKVIKKYEN